jgi:hypothetical protein
VAGDVHEYGLFGYSVTLTSDVALAGSYGDNGDSLSAGQAYIYSDYTGPVTSLDEKNDKRTRDLYLAQNYPNPFNPITKIKYELRKAAHIKLAINNLLGETIVELVDEYKPVGAY